jgi:RNase P/RNase MRP subunit p30
MIIKHIVSYVPSFNLRPRTRGRGANDQAATNTNALSQYDILSVAPTSDKALQLACTDLCLPGPNQISIITLPLHERPYFFRLNRKQIRQAQRNGVVVGPRYMEINGTQEERTNVSA